MQLWVGLGNPGAKYAGNRHNVGYMALDRIAEEAGVPWRAKFQGALAEARFGSERVWLLKPGTFMNLSGQSVGEAMRFHKLEPGDVTVFHDELDLAPGRLKLKRGGGHAGHNGLRSIHQHIGPDYARVRLGIGHPGHKDRVAGYVLSDFAKAEADMLDDLLRGILDGAPKLAAGDGPGFANAVALRVAPPRSSGGDRGGKKVQAAVAPEVATGAPEVDREPEAIPVEPATDRASKTSPVAPETPRGSEPKLSALQRLAARFR